MKQRVITGTIGGLIFVSLVIIGDIWFGILISCLALLAYMELIRMSGMRMSGIPALTGVLFLAALLLNSLSGAEALPRLEVAMDTERIITAFIVLFLFFTIFDKTRFTIGHVGILFSGIFYIGLGFTAFMETRFNYGLYFIFFILLLTWTSDSAAYFIGKKFGKRKMWPRISPNKTLEGHVGGVLCSMLFALVFQWVTGYFAHQGEALGLAVLLSVAGQVGDLIESALKRYYGVKDSGSILPGHGGVLDRFDSLLYVFILFHVLQII